MRDKQFERLLRAHSSALTAYARSLTHSVDLADDVVQTTFERAWRYADSFKLDGTFEAWLIRICRNVFFDLSATNSKFHSTQQDIEEVSCQQDNDKLSDTFNGVGELYMLIGSLPLHMREVLVICGPLGYDYETAAQILDIPIGTVRSRLFRARKLLEAELSADSDLSDSLGS